MMKKKLLSNVFIGCLLLSTVTIISGCSSKGVKKEKIISLQKRRIQKLETQLKRQNQVISKLKTKRWINSEVKTSVKVELRQITSLMKKGQWVSALKKSSIAKKKYPRSLQLRSLRIKIFTKMGLKDQAIKERKILRSLRVQKQKRRA